MSKENKAFSSQVFFVKHRNAEFPTYLVKLELHQIEVTLKVRQLLLVWFCLGKTSKVEETKISETLRK